VAMIRPRFEIIMTSRSQEGSLTVLPQPINRTLSAIATGIGNQNARYNYKIIYTREDPG
jgi:hypothetical protein